LVEAQVGVRPSPKTRVYADGKPEVLGLVGKNISAILVHESNAGKTAAQLAFEQ
jgi:hypothetical protein